jgi:hypothetical protein
MPINIHHSVEYTSRRYSKQPPVNVQLTGPIYGLKFIYMMYTRVDIEEYHVLLPSECLQKFTGMLHVTSNNYQSKGHEPKDLNISCPQQ